MGDSPAAEREINSGVGNLAVIPFALINLDSAGDVQSDRETVLVINIA